MLRSPFLQHLARHQLTLPDHEHDYDYAAATRATHCTYDKVDGQAELTIPRWFTCPRTTHTYPGTNKCWCQVTVLIKTSTLPHQHILKQHQTINTLLKIDNKITSSESSLFRFLVAAELCRRFAYETHQKFQFNTTTPITVGRAAE